MVTQICHLSKISHENDVKEVRGGGSVRLNPTPNPTESVPETRELGV